MRIPVNHPGTPVGPLYNRPKYMVWSKGENLTLTKYPCVFSVDFREMSEEVVRVNIELLETRAQALVRLLCLVVGTHFHLVSSQHLSEIGICINIAWTLLTILDLKLFWKVTLFSAPSWGYFPSVCRSHDVMSDVTARADRSMDLCSVQSRLPQLNALLKKKREFEDWTTNVQMRDF